MNRALSLVVLCIVSASFAHALCADRDFRVYTFGGGFNVVGLEGGDYYQSCCTFSAGCPSAYFDDWCVGTTYKCSCTIKSDECASNITKYLQTGNEGILWLAGSEGYMAYLPLLQPGQFVRYAAPFHCSLTESLSLPSSSPPLLFFLLLSITCAAVGAWM